MTKKRFCIENQWSVMIVSSKETGVTTMLTIMILCIFLSGVGRLLKGLFRLTFELTGLALIFAIIPAIVVAALIIGLLHAILPVVLIVAMVMGIASLITKKRPAFAQNYREL